MIDPIYQRRRSDLMQYLRDGIAIVTTAPHQQRNGDVLFQFRPARDFYYLTHFPEPEAIAVLAPGRPEGEFLLFCRQKDPHKEQWDGKRSGLEGARELYGADQAFSFEDFEQKLPELLDNRDKVYTMMGRYPEFDAELLNCINLLRKKQRSGTHAPWEYVDLRHILHEMRVTKTKEEIKTKR